MHAEQQSPGNRAKISFDGWSDKVKLDMSGYRSVKIPPGIHKSRMIREATAWCVENIGPCDDWSRKNRWIMAYDVFYFSDETDLVAFALTFSEVG